MEATASIQFNFRVGKRTVVVERQISMSEFIKSPSDYGDTLRSAWFHARADAAKKHQEFQKVVTKKEVKP